MRPRLTRATLSKTCPTPSAPALESREKVNNLFVLVLAVMVAETRERKNGGKKERRGERRAGKK
tara:strand:- start:133 stop:324 length:192 start_codon:yes stop_codon:yes gene_type:complete